MASPVELKTRPPVHYSETFASLPLIYILDKNQFPLCKTDKCRQEYL